MIRTEAIRAQGEWATVEFGRGRRGRFDHGQKRERRWTDTNDRGSAGQGGHMTA